MSFKKPSARKTPLSIEKEKKLESFVNAAPIITTPTDKDEGGGSQEKNSQALDQKKEKPNKGFTVPLNNYELGLLRLLQQNEERSMRVIARRLFVKALAEEAEQYKSDPNGLN